MKSLRLACCPVTIYLGKMAKRVVRNFVSLSVNIPFLFGVVCVKSGILNLIAQSSWSLSFILLSNAILWYKYAYLFL